MPELSSITRSLDSAVLGTMLNRPIRLGVFGDSTATTFSGLSFFDIESPAFSVDTINAAYGTNVLGVLSYVSALPVASCGVGGQKVSDMLARGALDATDNRRSVQDLISKKPDVVILHGGSINDYSNLSTSSTDAQILEVADLHCQLVEMFTSVGILVVDSGTLGYYGANDSSDLITFVRRCITLTNAYIKNRSRTNTLHLFVDVDGTLSDSGVYRDGISTDGVHLTTYGGRLLGELEKSALSVVYGVNKTGSTRNEPFTAFAVASPTSNPSRHSTTVANNAVITGTETSATRCKKTITVAGGVGSVYISPTGIGDLMTSLGVVAGKTVSFEMRFTLTSNVQNAILQSEYRLTVFDSANTAATKRVYGTLSFPVKSESDDFSVPVIFKAPDALGSNTSFRFALLNIPEGIYELTFYPLHVSVY